MRVRHIAPLFVAVFAVAAVSRADIFLTEFQGPGEQDAGARGSGSSSKAVEHEASSFSNTSPSTSAKAAVQKALGMNITGGGSAGLGGVGGLGGAIGLGGSSTAAVPVSSGFIGREP